MSFSMKHLLRPFLTAILALALVAPIHAREGMWIPYLLSQLNASEMTAMGMEISAADIYAVNNSSLKDAIVHFGGGCTAELISDKGLLLTNHHCGYGRIQSHSSVENDYLKNGFWAMSAEEELANPGLTASIVKYMEDVTNKVLEGVTADMGTEKREEIIKANAETLIALHPAEYQVEVRPFFYGNQYILIAKEVFKDVRLVGAPPSSIGKFGADTDNWVWPRHTGDFSLFRVYAGRDNKPAEHSDENIPYQPVKHLKINLSGFRTGDFTMIYGFPGRTFEYLPSNEIENIIEIYDPARIAIRDELLAILNKKMRESDETRIQYASKYASISNSWKKWIGEVTGLKQTDAVAKKRALEERFTAALAQKAEWQTRYGDVLPRLKALYDKRKPIMLERYVYLETNYYGSELIRHLLGYRNLMELYQAGEEEKLKAAAAEKAKGLNSFYKDYDIALDRKAMKALLPIYLNALPANTDQEMLQELKEEDADDRNEFIDELYEDLVLLEDTAKWRSWLLEDPEKAMKKLAKSDAMELTMAGWNYYKNTLSPQTTAIDNEIEDLQRIYVEALGTVFDDMRLYPDANSTLRVSYGKVHGYQPRDAVEYEPQTYLSGVIAKYIPGDYEFDLPKKLIELYETKNYGRYAQGEKMPVCFIASNHTTGGNSGSPALNGRGELIGLNFDRTWEGTMSDYHYDISLCRNIMVDIRYVLFIVDKFAGAGYLVNEMDIVTTPARDPRIPVSEDAPGPVVPN